MALTVQNLRAVGTGVEPASLLPGQIAFNVTDKVLFVGDGSNVKTAFDGTQTPGVPGGGWYAMPMDFASLGDYYVANPGYWGDVPTDQQVLTWSTSLNHPIWTSGGGGGGGNQVYVVTNTQVASASGATTSDKITAAIGVASPDEGDVTIVTGLPDDVYEGLYFFTTEWVKGAAYAYPSASEVIYDNTGRTLGATVQLAIDDLDDGLIATTAIANTANSTANSALSIASAALPKAGGTMTGTIVARSIDVQSGYNLQFLGSGYIAFNAGANGTITGITDAVSSTSSTLAGSANAVRLTYDLANAALARSGGTMTGAITFVAGQVFPVSGIQDATTSQKGVVQVGTNIQVAAGVISVLDSTTSNKGVVQLNDTLTSTLTTQALTARAGADLQGQIDSLTLASNVFLAGSLDASTGLIDSVTSLGGATVPPFVPGSGLPSPQVSLADYYVLVTTAGSYSPPLSPGGPYLAEPGDWFLCGETFLSSGVYVWQYLGVGARPQSATYTTAGIVQLADTAVTYAGTSDTEAITPNSLRDNMTDSVSTADSGLIATAQAVKTTYDLAAAAIPCSVVTGKGAIVTGTAVGTPTALPVGSNGQVLIANSACATGLEWVSDTPGDVTSVTATSPVTADNTDPQNPVIGIDAASTTQSGAVQLNDTTSSTSTTQAATANAVRTTYNLANAAVPNSSFLAKGNLLAGTGSATYGALGVGTDGQVLIADSGTATGLIWGDACYVPDACFTAAGDIIVGTGVGTYVALPIGASGQSLVVDLTCTATGGLKWGQSLIGYTCSATPFNTALGFQAGDSITSGVSNTVVGHNAGTAITGGSSNTVIGVCAGDALVGGSNNTAIGTNALGTNISGTSNVAIGSSSLQSSLCCQNTAVGNGSGCSVTIGTGHVYVGFLAGANSTSACNNTAVGWNALSQATAGSTTAVGYASLLALTSGARNTAVGACAGQAVTTGTDNTFIGFAAGDSATGTNNTLVGSNAGSALTLGGTNILIGANAGDTITTGFNNTIIGDVNGSPSLTDSLILAAGTTVKFQANASGAWSPDGTNYGTIGQVLTSNGTVAAPTWNTLSLACVPCAAFVACGDLLVGTGSATFTALPTGTNGQNLVVDTTCTATGGLKWVTTPQLCGFTCTATPFNTAFGSLAGAALTSLSVANTAIGYSALDSETSGDFNVAVGHNALTAQNGASGNVAIGGNAGAQVTNGGNNILIGCNAGDVITTGSDNIAIGGNAGGAATSGVQSVFIGSNAGLVANATGVTAIGFCAAQATTTSGCTTYVGWVSGRNATGLSNTYVGALTGCAASNSSACGTLFGFCAGSALTTGNGNSFVGFQAGRNVNTGGFNVAIGTAAFQTATTAANNVAVGCGALAGLSTTSGNTALGHRAMINASTAANNVVVGCSAGEQISTGSTNVFIGNTAGDAVTTGSSNTIIGDIAGSTTLANNLILAAGTTIKLQVNENGAVGVGSTPSYGTAGQVLKSAGTGAAPAWGSALYGAFSDSTIQTNTGGASGNPVDLDTTASANGFSIVSGSQITATTAGVYNIQISLQFEKTDGGTDAVEVWFKKNGTDIANSNTNIQLQGGGAKQLFALNLVEPLTAGQYLEVWWYSADANVQLASVAAGTRPAIPSAIVTVVPVGA